MLNDSQGRRIGYLRLSLTGACALRCVYCRPQALHHVHEPHRLDAGQIETLVRHLVVRHGLYKVRLTGGDPTSRPDLLEIIERLSRIEGLRDLAMTTHGMTLATQAVALREAGLRRVNISLDSLDEATFARITGVRGLRQVLRGIDAACDAGLQPIRLNTVVLAGHNDHELDALVRFAAARGLEIRFIELMPMGPLADRWQQCFVSAADMRQRLARVMVEDGTLTQGHDSAVRTRWRLDDGSTATVGFITPMSCNFCDACNRLRLTAQGDLYPCLMDRPRGNLLAAWAGGFDPDRLDGLLASALQHKAPEHPAQGFTPMTILGG